MSAPGDAAWLLGAVLAVLGLSSAVGAALRRFVARGRPHPAIDNLNQRIATWWALALLVGGAALLGHVAVVLLFALVSFCALREFLTLTPTRRADHRALSFAFFAVLPAQYLLVSSEWYGMFAVFIPVYVFLALPILIASGADTTRFLERTAEIQWGLMICVYGISHVPALLAFALPGSARDPLWLLLYLLIVVQASDVLQYAWGKLCGRRRIAPALSPSKTLEGLLGGALCSVALGAALSWMTPFSPVASAAFSLLIVAMGFLGGLAMSAIKRGRGVKDWGVMLAGHGGMLDRLDSVCFAAPVFFHVTRYFYG